MRVLVALALALALAGSAAAEPRSDPGAALERSESAIGRGLPDLAFTDTNGRRVRLADFRGKPLLLSLVYTGCADVCPTLIDSLGLAVPAARDALGPDAFAVAVIGFDVRHDTPDRMRSFARVRGVDHMNWSFLAADAPTLDRLVDAVGFSFTPVAGGFEHMAVVSVIDRDGRLYAQVYGGGFKPPAIVEPLKDLVFSRAKPVSSLAGLIDRVKLICTLYDPVTGRYYFNYSIFLGIGIGAACLLLVAAALVREWRRTMSRSA